MFGAIYLLQPQEFAGSNIYKIGMTKMSDGSRVASYGADTTILRVVECSNPIDVEKELIKEFNLKFLLNRGKEYFEGDEESMIQCFDNCVVPIIELPQISDINIENTLKDIQSMIESNENITLQQVFKLCIPIYDSIGIDDVYRQRLKQLSKVQGFAINANIELKFFGIVADGQKSAMIRRCLAHQYLLHPKGPEYDTRFYGIIEESPYCRAIRTELRKNGRTYKKIEYMITWTGFFKVITRSVNHNKYSTYFAIQSQTLAMMP